LQKDVLPLLTPQPDDFPNRDYMAEGSDGEATISVVIVFTLLVYLKAKKH